MALHHDTLLGSLRELSRQLGGQLGELNRQVRRATASLISDAVSQFARETLFRAMLGRDILPPSRRVPAQERDYDPWSESENDDPEDEPARLGKAKGESTGTSRESGSWKSGRTVSQLFLALAEITSLLPGWMLTGRLAEILASRGPLSRFARALILEARSLVVVSAILARAERPLGLPADSTRP